VAIVHRFVKSELEGGSTPQRKFSVPLAHAANMKERYESIWESLRMTNLSGSYVVF
jgi:hypothetical protein